MFTQSKHRPLAEQDDARGYLEDVIRERDVLRKTVSYLTGEVEQLLKDKEQLTARNATLQAMADKALMKYRQMQGGN